MRNPHLLGRVMSAFAVGLGLFSFTSRASAQLCVGPDNLSFTTCCAPTTATLPAFPAVTLPGLGICWNNCVPAVLNNLTVTMSAPSSVRCAEFVSLLTAIDVATGSPVLTGKVTLDYTRTWTETAPSGIARQVWRFVAKADLQVVLTGIVPPCPAPSCLAPFGTQPTAFYYGYVDYASPCGSGAISENAVVLYHACDFFIHRPGFSDRPGQFHPTRSYAIVAPHSTTQPFVASNNPSPSGPMLAEASREMVVPGSTFCAVEDPVVGGQIGLLGGACLCPGAPAPKHHQFRSFQGTTSCVDATGVNGSFQALNFSFPNLPWFNLTTSNIGCWTNGNVYPGKECAWVDEGLFLHNAPCSGSWIGIYYGASTKDGWTANVGASAPVRGFTDLADNYTAPLLGPYTVPIFGSSYTTDRLIYVNTP